MTNELKKSYDAGFQSLAEAFAFRDKEIE